MRKTSWRAQCDFNDFEVVMRDGNQCDGYQQGKTATQLNPELKRSAELDGSDEYEPEHRELECKTDNQV